ATSDDFLRDYAIKNGRLTLHATSSTKFVDPGATPSISADGNRNAIVWAIATKTWNGPDTKHAVLYAFDATKLGEPIYNSEQNSQRDRAALAARFVIPIVVNGHVYFGTRSEVEVYGLLKQVSIGLHNDAWCPTPAKSRSETSVAVNSAFPLTLTTH